MSPISLGVYGGAVAGGGSGGVEYLDTLFMNDAPVLSSMSGGGVLVGVSSTKSGYATGVTLNGVTGTEVAYTAHERESATHRVVSMWWVPEPPAGEAIISYTWFDGIPATRIHTFLHLIGGSTDPTFDTSVYQNSNNSSYSTPDMVVSGDLIVSQTAVRGRQTSTHERYAYQAPNGVKNDNNSVGVSAEWSISTQTPVGYDSIGGFPAVAVVGISQGA